MSHLLYTCCIPILSYASVVKEYSSRQMQDCTTAINDSLRIIFGYNRWESVRTLRESLGYKSLIDIFHRSKRKFDASLLTHHNPVISHIARNVVVEPEWFLSLRGFWFYFILLTLILWSYVWICRFFLVYFFCVVCSWMLICTFLSLTDDELKEHIYNRGYDCA